MACKWIDRQFVSSLIMTRSSRCSVLLRVHNRTALPVDLVWIPDAGNDPVAYATLAPDQVGIDLDRRAHALTLSLALHARSPDLHAADVPLAQMEADERPPRASAPATRCPGRRQHGRRRSKRRRAPPPSPADSAPRPARHARPGEDPRRGHRRHGGPGGQRRVDRRLRRVRLVHLRCDARNVKGGRPRRDAGRRCGNCRHRRPTGDDRRGRPSPPQGEGRHGRPRSNV